MDCRMNGEQAATYYLSFASEALKNMEDPGISISNQVCVSIFQEFCD